MLTTAVASLLMLAAGQDLEAEINGLISKLRATKDGDVGYMATMSGSKFSALEEEGQPGAMLLGQEGPAPSAPLRDLVKKGSAAIPYLIAHLDDAGKTQMTVKHDMGMGGMFFADEYDTNRRTRKAAPEGVNRGIGFERGPTPKEHALTVGDLCFVALGQIVNRSFNAVRYQPTACIMINSPTYSQKLLKTIKDEWGTLTPEQHRQSLIRDFVEPDHEYRRQGACLRLGYYYPEALEPLVLKQLAEPRYNVFEVQALIREKLYKTQDSKARKDLLAGFLVTRGEVARQGVLLYLFEDLDMQEADEEGRLGPPLTEKYAARSSLVDLFGYPQGVKSKDRPAVMPLENCSQARFIDTLLHFHTEAIDRAVREVLHSADEIYLARACARYLVGRGADKEILKYVEQRLPGADQERRKELEEMKERVGWTPLHVAADQRDSGLVERLLARGAEINARAANGQTALHVAASRGNYGVIRALLKRNADPNAEDGLGRRPAQLGICYEGMARMLLEAGAVPNDILVASYAGRADIVKDLLAKDKTLARAALPDGESALHFAAQHDRINVAELLLANGADPNFCGERSKLTPLHYAAWYAGAEMVELLLANKADRTAKTWDGKTALQCATEHKNKAALDVLERQK
jgi:ankyrin repeat protein